MGNSIKHLAALGLAAICFTGCASAGYKPQGLTDKEAENKVNALIYECQWLHQGSYISISFYPDAAEGANKEYRGSKSGYFYACNKMSGTLSMSRNRITMYDRGEIYPLSCIQTISKLPDPVPQTAMADDLLDTIVKKVFEVRHDDPERSLLTQ
jgi:hypothetical protein